MLEIGSWRSPAGPLSALGFATDNGWQFRRQDVVLAIGDDWWTFRAAAVAGEEAGLQRPGLWKPDRAPPSQVLDLPVGDLALREAGERELEQLVDWVMDSRAVDWRPHLDDAPLIPPLPAGALTARAGTHTCQGELYQADSRCWIDYRLAEVRDDLPPERMAWLGAIRQATDRFRMVRVDVDPGTAAVHARIDLSGIAPPLRDALLGAALPRLRATVGALLPAITLITDTGVGSRAMALGGPM